MTLSLLCCLLHVYLFIEINYLIQGLVMGSARLKITILHGKVSAALVHRAMSSSQLLVHRRQLCVISVFNP